MFGFKFQMPFGLLILILQPIDTGFLVSGSRSKFKRVWNFLQIYVQLLTYFFSFYFLYELIWLIVGKFVKLVACLKLELETEEIY
jgi:hypothetical protein